jgi:hypothetical protein
VPRDARTTAGLSARPGGLLSAFHRPGRTTPHGSFVMMRALRITHRLLPGRACVRKPGKGGVAPRTTLRRSWCTHRGSVLNLLARPRARDA